MSWRVEFTEKAKENLKKLDKPVRDRITAYAHRLEAAPDPYQLGTALTGSLSGLWRFRVGDYRLVCEMQDNVLTVLVVWLGHRREVYRRK